MKDEMKGVQLLNEELARWAGFNRTKGSVQLRDTTYEAFHWEHLNHPGRWFRFSEELIFTHSLDACFKWLVPKLPAFSLISYGGNKGFGVVINYPHFEAEAQTAALALCFAIGKMINAKANTIQPEEKQP